GFGSEKGTPGGGCPPQKKNDQSAKTTPKHLHHRVRPGHFPRKPPPLSSIRTSPAAASKHTLPRKKCIPAGTPFFSPVPPRNASTPAIQPRIPITSGIAIAAQSQRLVSPSLRLAVSPTVIIR